MEFVKKHFQDSDMVKIESLIGFKLRFRFGWTTNPNNNVFLAKQGEERDFSASQYYFFYSNKLYRISLGDKVYDEYEKNKIIKVPVKSIVLISENKKKCSKSVDLSNLEHGFLEMFSKAYNIDNQYSNIELEQVNSDNYHLFFV